MMGTVSGNIILIFFKICECDYKFKCYYFIYLFYTAEIGYKFNPNFYFCYPESFILQTEINDVTFTSFTALKPFSTS